MSDNIHSAAELPQSRSYSMPNSWAILLLGFVAVLGGGAVSFAVVSQYLDSRPLDLHGPTIGAASDLEALFESNGIPDEHIARIEPTLRSTSESEYYYFAFAVQLSEGVDATLFAESLWPRVQERGVVVKRLEAEGPGSTYLLSVVSTPFGYVRLLPSELEGAVTLDAMLPDDNLQQYASSPVKSEEDAPALDDRELRVAIILDDGGYGGEVTDKVLALDSALTLAILPYTPYAKSTARRASESGFEVMLHMPMENADSEMIFEGQLEVGMSPSEIKELTRTAFEQIPGATGVNNHTGSRFTEDAESMSIFLNQVRALSLYFVDSMTSPDSKGLKIAKEAGVGSVGRDIFLDHDNDPDAIRRRFEELLELVQRRGDAIAIAHFRPNTVDVLAECLPLLEENGIELVHASVLVE